MKKPTYYSKEKTRIADDKGGGGWNAAVADGAPRIKRASAEGVALRKNPVAVRGYRLSGHASVSRTSTSGDVINPAIEARGSRTPFSSSVANPAIEARGEWASLPGGVVNPAGMSRVTPPGNAVNPAGGPRASLPGGAMNQAGGSRASLPGSTVYPAGRAPVSLPGGAMSQAGGARASSPGGAINPAGRAQASLPGNSINPAGASRGASASPAKSSGPADAARIRQPAKALASAPAPAAKRRAVGRILLIICISLAAALSFAASPFFAVDEINVSGNSFYEKNHIIAKSGLKIGQNGFAALRGRNALKLLSLRCDGAERAATLACPYVKSLRIRYALPGTINIDVEERGKSVIVPYFDSGLLIDEEGVVVDIVGDYRRQELPVVYGMNVTQYEVGKALAVNDESKMETVISIINALRQADRNSDEALSWKISSIDISDRRRILLVLNNGISVNLGDGADLYYRVSATKEIVAHGIREGETGAISFSTGARPVFAPRGEGAAPISGAPS